MVLLVGSPKAQFFDTTTGEPLVAGKVYSYVGGSVNTPKATYPTVPDAEANTNANTNPIILDARGEAAIVVDGSTKLTIADANDNVIYSVDYVDGLSQNAVTIDGDIVISLDNNVNSVNYWKIANSATTDPLTITAIGTDANIEGRISSKGNGKLYLDGGSTGSLELNTLSSGNINCNGNTTVTGTCTVTSTLTASANATVAGTLGVTGAATLPTITATAITQSGVAGGIVPVGGMIAYGLSSPAPSGWLTCNGQAVSRTTYSALFAVIGTTFGVGDGSTTFNVPNTARRTVVGSGGAGTATLGNSVGSTGGAETHTLVTSETPAHTHSISSFTSVGVTLGAAPINAVLNTTTTGSTGGDGSHNNMQPSIVMHYIIKT